MISMSDKERSRLVKVMDVASRCIQGLLMVGRESEAIALLGADLLGSLECYPECREAHRCAICGAKNRLAMAMEKSTSRLEAESVNEEAIMRQIKALGDELGYVEKEPN